MSDRTSSRRRGAVLLAAGLAAAMGAAGCSLGNRQAMADAVVAAGNRALAARTATGQLKIDVALVHTTETTEPGPPRITPTQVPTSPVAMNLAAAQATVGAVAGGTPAIVFDGSRIYQHRATKSIPSSGAAATNLSVMGAQTSAAAGVLAQLAAAAGAGGAGAGGAATGATGSTGTAAAGGAGGSATPLRANQRPWLELDYDQLPKRDSDKTAGSLGVSPNLVVLLLRGALTGSTHRVGTDVIGGSPAVHYKLNLGLNEAEHGLPDKSQVVIAKILRANAITGTVFPAEVWIGSDGLPRRIDVRFRQRLDQLDRADLRLELDLTGWGSPVTIAVPGKEETAVVQNFGQLVHAAVA